MFSSNLCYDSYIINTSHRLTTILSTCHFLLSINISLPSFILWYPIFSIIIGVTPPGSKHLSLSTITVHTLHRCEDIRAKTPRSACVLFPPDDQTATGGESPLKKRTRRPFALSFLGMIRLEQQASWVTLAGLAYGEAPVMVSRPL